MNAQTGSEGTRNMDKKLRNRLLGIALIILWLIIFVAIFGGKIATIVITGLILGMVGALPLVVGTFLLFGLFD